MKALVSSGGNKVPTMFKQLSLWSGIDAANDPIFDSNLFKRAIVARELSGSLEEKSVWKLLMRRQRGRCAACSRHTRSVGRFEKDHHCALINGGDNSISNQRLL